VENITSNPRVPLTYLTTEELAQRIKYDVRTIRDRLKDSVLLEGRHYIRPLVGARRSTSGSTSKRTWGAARANPASRSRSWGEG